MANLSHITRCGLPGIEWVPFGMHACHFYSSTDQLVARLKGLDVVQLWQRFRFGLGLIGLWPNPRQDRISE
jgi:hypothetical protein